MLLPNLRPQPLFLQVKSSCDLSRIGTSVDGGGWAPRPWAAGLDLEALSGTMFQGSGGLLSYPAKSESKSLKIGALGSQGKPVRTKLNLLESYWWAEKPSFVTKSEETTLRRLTEETIMGIRRLCSFEVKNNFCADAGICWSSSTFDVHTTIYPTRHLAERTYMTTNFVCT